MDTRLKEIVDNFEKMKIGVDEPFKFHCTMCGKCCINREDILLTPKDLYNMSKELKIFMLEKPHGFLLSGYSRVEQLSDARC